MFRQALLSVLAACLFVPLAADGQTPAKLPAA